MREDELTGLVRGVERQCHPIRSHIICIDAPTRLEVFFPMSISFLSHVSLSCISQAGGRALLNGQSLRSGSLMPSILKIPPGSTGRRGIKWQQFKDSCRLRAGSPRYRRGLVLTGSYPNTATARYEVMGNYCADSSEAPAASLLGSRESLVQNLRMALVVQFALPSNDSPEVI